MTWVAMSERKKRKKKKEKGLNKVGSRGRIVAVGGGVGMTSRWCLQVARWCGGGMIRLTVGGLGCDSCGRCWWQCGAEQVKRACGQRVGVVVGPTNRVEGVVVVNFHGVGAELSHGGVPVVEIDGDGVRNDTKKKKPLPISSSSATVLGGFAQRGDDGGELEATAGAMG
ncbi:hypothetical protein EDB83DRAFT_2317162 [Lactarius deliciosus]|nr:hypothetical protein EDB83DRAFT_2317162 [Lactarius deliciosus]